MGQIAAVDFTEAVAMFATGVTLVTVRDDRDDIGTTVSAFCSASLDPPLVLVSVAAEAYLNEVLHRRDGFAVTILGADQKALAGRFAAAGRPSARLLLANVAHHRGPLTGALIVDGGLAALECATRQRVPAGDHTLFVAEVTGIRYVNRGGAALVRVGGRYRTL